MWFLKEETARALAIVFRSGLRAPSDAQLASLVEMVKATRERVYAVNGEVAEIRVQGVLTKGPDLFMMLFGGGNTTYRDIIAAVDSAAADGSIKRVELIVDSPGGSADGLFDALASLEGLNKPMTARCSEACSAAYAIAATANKIEATGVASEFGSIGVAATFFVDDALIDVTSTEAPEKRPDVRTEEGKAAVRKYLDALHDIFVDSIARGRKTTASNVNANYGRGNVVLAEEARRLGMVDAVVKPRLRIVPRAESEPRHEPSAPPADAASQPTQTDPAGSGEKKSMKTLADLRAQHPELYEQAVALGTSLERDRVCAHVVMGRQSGDTETMFTAITEGQEMSATLQANYMAAAMNRADQRTRQQESNAANDAVAGVGATNVAQPEGDMGDRVMARRNERRGKK